MDAEPIIRSPERALIFLRTVPLIMGTSGCSGSAAPNYVLFGAFFPAWLLCGLIGILAAVMARAAFVATRLTEVIPAQLLVCTAIGIIVASLFWLVWIG